MLSALSYRLHPLFSTGSDDVIDMCASQKVCQDVFRELGSDHSKTIRLTSVPGSDWALKHPVGIQEPPTPSSPSVSGTTRLLRQRASAMDSDPEPSPSSSSTTTQQQPSLRPSTRTKFARKFK